MSEQNEVMTPAENSVLARIALVADQLTEVTNLYSVDNVGDALRKADLKTLAMVHARINELHEQIDDARKTLSKTYDWLRHSLMVDRMDEAGLESFSVAGVGRVYIQSSLNASIKAGAKEGAYQWLDDHGHGDLIGTTVNSSSLKALAKVKMQENEPLPEDLFNVSPKTFVVIQKK